MEYWTHWKHLTMCLSFFFYLGFNFNLGLAIKDESYIVGCGKTSPFLISFDPIFVLTPKRLATFIKWELSIQSYSGPVA